MSRIIVSWVVVVWGAGPVLAADGPASPRQQFQAFIMKQAAELRKGDRAPESLEAWKKQAAELRRRLYEVWGGEACFLTRPCDLDPRQHGEPLRRDGYTVEKVSFQTRPGVRMTANLYIPDAARTRPAPAILMVHGHWRLAKVEPVVQTRCIGAAKLGFVVLCVDAFGAGERGVGPALGEYHGEMTAATLFPVGLPLSGLQVYENMRAVDYLETRPEVDKSRIGITGASGGGNQTMYAGAWDERFKCVVPVCSVGNYQAYLHTACCMCEVVPGALQFTEEWAVLALTAPRPLMVINAARDGIQFSVGEAKKSLALTAPVYRLFGRSENLRHVTFDEGHGYSKAMREAMYGFMTLHLKGEGDGSPIPEPEIRTEDPENLRCYPGNRRPPEFVTIPRLAAAEARRLLAAADDLSTPGRLADTRGRLSRLVAAESRPVLDPKAENASDGERRIRWSPAEGVTLTATVQPGRKDTLVVILNLEGAEAARRGPISAAARSAGMRVATFDLRTTGRLADPQDRIGRAPDHTPAQWALWLGRPLLLQWVWDLQSFLLAFKQLDGASPAEIVVVGEGPAGLVALVAAAALEPGTIRGLVLVDSPVTLVTDRPYDNLRMGLFVPSFLRDFGDVPHVAALSAPIPLAICGGTGPQGQPLGPEEIRAAFRFTTEAARDTRRKIVWTTPDRALSELGFGGGSK